MNGFNSIVLSIKISDETTKFVRQKTENSQAKSQMSRFLCIKQLHLLKVNLHTSNTSRQLKKSFKFEVGVSAAPKKIQKTLHDPNELSVQVGEDAYFYRKDALGVADGVGGWCSVRKADPALFSRRLMHYISSELEKYDDLLNEEISSLDYYNIDPRKIMQQGLNALLNETKDQVLGSTTALITILRVISLQLILGK